MSSQIQNTSGRKLFSYHIQNQIAKEGQQKMFFKRIFRYRNNTYHQVQPLKFLKLRNPFLFAVCVAVVYDYAFCWYLDPPKGH